LPGLVRADVREPADLERAVDVARDEFGGIDFVHLNAGLALDVSMPTDLDPAMVRRVVDVNLLGVLYGVRAALPALRARGGGAVVATASLAGLTPFPDDPVYAMTKHAVVGLVRSLGPVLAGDRITINAVCPGFADTELLAPHARASGYPLLAPDEVARAVLTAARSGQSGQAWVCQPGRPADVYRFRGVPGAGDRGGDAPGSPTRYPVAGQGETGPPVSRR
jgi:NAD(P)-dependent dehydrogenase (short-subunit alcohol dehydrogenase family)